MIQQSQRQSGGLSTRLKAMANEGRSLIDDSSKSESNLNAAMIDYILPYAEKTIAEHLPPGTQVDHLTKITLYDLQCEFYKTGRGNIPNDINKKVFIKPDGGIITATTPDGVKYPLLISEDKVQGTNDQRRAEQKERQATGNAIERAAKNIRTCEMLCAHVNYFPYLLFASGCDFHISETISKRIVMMNMGTPNHYVDIAPTSSENDIEIAVDNIVNSLDIRKKWGHCCIATAVVKAHKWNEMPHLTSLWRKEEYVRICCKAIDLAVQQIIYLRTESETSIEMEL